MPLIMSQKLYQLEYDDIVGERYHYPKCYWSYVKLGEIFIYYHPSEKQDPHRYYFGVGRIGSVLEDPERTDHRYAEIVDYVNFDAPVPFKDNGRYLEAKPNVGTQFFRAVRLISDEIFDRIIRRTELEPKFLSEFQSVRDIDDIDQILADLNRQYRELGPKFYRKMVTHIERPTSISRALKRKLGYTCQICHSEGFKKKTGDNYAEAHHLLPMHELSPGTLVSENVIIVCANCHRKLHYANVNIKILSSNEIEIIINGTPHKVRRNLL